MSGDQTVWPRFRDAASRARYGAAYDAALAGWPVAGESVTIPTPLGPAHAVISGPAGAPLLVLLPSFAGTALAWRPNVAALSQDWRVCALDVVGQTGKSVAHGAIGGEAGYARWLDAVLDHLGAAKASLVGCSFGGFVAASYARLRPGRVDRLVLIGPVGVFAAMPLTLALRMIARGMLRQLRRRLGDRRAPSAALHAAAAPKHPEDEPWRRLMATTMAEAAKSHPMRPRVFSRAELAQIAAPTLLLIGQYEMLYDPQTVAAKARAMKPGLTAEVIAGADHIAAMAQPEAVNARIATFLRGAAV